MKKVIPLPRKNQATATSVAAMKNIEKRFGVSFWEYMGFIGDKEKVREKIDRALHKETLQIATRIAEEARNFLIEDEKCFRVPLWEYIAYKEKVREKKNDLSLQKDDL